MEEKSAIKLINEAIRAIIPGRYDDSQINPVTDDFDLVKATRLFYTVMCLKRYFPGWGVCMRPVRIPPRGSTARDNSASNQAEENQQRSESSDSEQSNQDGEPDDSDTEPLISNP